MFTHEKKLFNNFQSGAEQRLLQGLVSESTSMVGEDIYYIPRVKNNLNALLSEDSQSSYTDAIPLVAYIESFEGWDTGENTFLSKFGLEIRSQITFAISRETFDSEVTRLTQKSRPGEGDLIYFPLNNKLFQIVFVDKFEMFYPLGALYSWKCDTQLFEYSNETINTGIPEIDAIMSLSMVTA